MNRALEHYRSLNYPIEVIREEDGFFVFHPDLDGCAAQGDTIEEAITNLDAARELWLKVRIEDHLPIEEPVDESRFNGRISLRTSSALHAELMQISRRQRVSLNQLLNGILSEYVGGNRLYQQAVEVIREIKSLAPVNVTTTYSLPASMPGAQYMYESFLVMQDRPRRLQESRVTTDRHPDSTAQVV